MADNGRPGTVSRRALLRSTGTGVAAVSLVGLGTATGPANARSTLPAPVTGGALRAVDPHAGTEQQSARFRPTRVRPARVEGPELVILPLDGATFLAGARWDLRVEAHGVDPERARIDLVVTDDEGPAKVLKGDPERTSTEPDSLEVTYRGLVYPRPGAYRVVVTVESGDRRSRAIAVHRVEVTRPPERCAKNVVFFLGDGMGQAAITAARIMSKGVTGGRYNGKLELDRMQYRGFVGTCGAESIATDSANSMSAYMTGHKTWAGAMGVYVGNEPDPAAHPHVETMAELLKRARGMAVGIVTTAEIVDATPAAVFAHTRRRGEAASILDQALRQEQMPDVLLGGGLGHLIPSSESDSDRHDDRDLRAEFEDAGFTFVGTRTELLRATEDEEPRRLLGAFHPGNLNTSLDRRTGDPDVLGEWTDQPSLPEMATAALEVLEERPEGFFLMVEAALIDKMQHPLDGPRAAYEAIELDQAITAVRRWLADEDLTDDTLLIVTADHNHSMSVIGTHDKRRGERGRNANRIYGDAGFPTYSDSTGDGFPDDPDPDVQLCFGWSSRPDHTDDFRANPTPLPAAMVDASGVAVSNPDRDPNAELQTGNLPSRQATCVHTVDDVLIAASGPGAERVNGFLDNTEVFFVIAHALGLEL